MGKIFYIKVKFEGIWGRKSNTKWGGGRIKGHRTIYTPAWDDKPNMLG